MLEVGRVVRAGGQHRDGRVFRSQRRHHAEVFEQQVRVMLDGADRLGVIDIVEKCVERLHALLQAALELAPLVRGDDCAGRCRTESGALRPILLRTLQR